jgi:hypothetical protein
LIQGLENGADSDLSLIKEYPGPSGLATFGDPPGYPSVCPAMADEDKHGPPVPTYTDKYMSYRIAVLPGTIT